VGGGVIGFRRTTAAVSGSDLAVTADLGGGVVVVDTAASVTVALGLLESTARGILTTDEGGLATRFAAGLSSGSEDGGSTAISRTGVVGVGATAGGVGEVRAIEEVLATAELVSIVIYLATTAVWTGEVGGLEELAATAGLLGWVVGLAVAAGGLGGSSLQDFSIRTTGLGDGFEGMRNQVRAVLAARKVGGCGDNRVSAALLGGGGTLTKSVISSVECAASVTHRDGLVPTA